MEYHAAHVFSNWWFCYFCLTDWAIGGIIVRGVLSLQRMFLSKYLGNNHKVWPFLLGHCDRETVQFLIWIMIWQIHYMVFIGLSPCPVTVTTRIILFFVGDPEEKNIFTTITGRGSNPVFQHILMQQQPSTSQPPQSPNGTALFHRNRNVTGLGRGNEVGLGDSGTLKWRAFLIATGGFLESLEETESLRDFWGTAV